MKSLLLFILAIPFGIKDVYLSASPEIAKKSGTLANAIVGQWKKIAAGQDGNNNRVLEESEKMRLEPSAQDNIHLTADGKCKVFGMDMQVEGKWLTKKYNGKETLFIYTNDIEQLPQDKKDKSAMRFEIVSLEDGKLVVIPPLYSFLLAVYARDK